jgi:hypothetical protein
MPHKEDISALYSDQFLYDLPCFKTSGTVLCATEPSSIKCFHFLQLTASTRLAFTHFYLLLYIKILL